ncbi:hypothetical protein GCM10010510_46820 [Streptomyces anandii JCM 4720]|nr:hypothetical protein GCM10010510_46820 [Streptomyces anandii JCM 4720]
MTAATARKDSPFTAYAAPGPQQPITTPASAVPPTRPAPLTTEPSAMDEGTSFGGTRSLPSRAQAGASTVAIRPVTAASTIRTGTDSRSVTTRAAVTKPTSASSAWLTEAVIRRGQASTAAPPASPSNSPGAACADSDRPVAAAEPVRWRTRRFCAVSCIQVPALDTRLAADHQRMPGWRRARHGARSSAVALAGRGRRGEGRITRRGPAACGRAGAAGEVE